MSKTDHYIEDIYNYCDRWCERCKYTNRCYSFQKDLEDGIDRLNSDSSAGEVFAEVGKRLAEALEMLHHYATSQGIDLNKLPDLEEEAPRGKVAQLEELSQKIHKEYIARTQAFFNENKVYFLDKGHESVRWAEMGLYGEEETLAKWQEVNDQAELIQWYSFFIGMKMRRAIGGIDAMHEDHWASPEQSDANRTARIAMLAIERSMAGWQLMLGAFSEKEDDIISNLALLDRFRRILVTTFPRWAEAGPAVVW